VEYRYDRQRRVHRLFPAVPGSVALSIQLSHAWPIALHEFAHAASECQTGRLIDAYVDGGDEPRTMVNKKYLKRTGLPVPARFCTYGIGDQRPKLYKSDAARDDLGYPPSWRSYHPEALEPSAPNLMDGYRLAKVDPARCRFDRLTYQWLWDRIWAKANR
jgi:hypothetical protein